MTEETSAVVQEFRALVSQKQQLDGGLKVRAALQELREAVLRCEAEMAEEIASGAISGTESVGPVVEGALIKVQAFRETLTGGQLGELLDA